MEPYIIQGVVLPERAQITLKFERSVTHLTSGITVTARVSIILNQVIIWIESDFNWDIFDLRNLVKAIVQNHLAIIAYLTGRTYELELTRVLHHVRGIDHVFGIDIPCISEMHDGDNLQQDINNIVNLICMYRGMWLDRCFNDLSLAMKNPDDTAFYCYRALESLMHHSSDANNISNCSKKTQWERFRSLIGCCEQDIMQLKVASDPLRHGHVTSVTSTDRASWFQITWNIVKGYIKYLDSSPPPSSP